MPHDSPARTAELDNSTLSQPFTEAEAAAFRAAVDALVGDRVRLPDFYEWITPENFNGTDRIHPEDLPCVVEAATDDPTEPEDDGKIEATERYLDAWIRRTR